MSNHHRPLIIVNREAAKARRSWPTVREQLRACGLEFDFHETTHAGEATTLTREELKSGRRTIAVVGGDGTLSEAAEGFFEFNEAASRLPSSINSEAALAILPAGTGDDVALGLLRRRAPLEEWIQAFVLHCRGDDSASVRLIDVLYGTCSSYGKPFICINASTMGLGGDTAARVSKQGTLMRKRSGKFRFVAGAIGALAAWRERRVRVSVDGEVFLDALMNLVAVANGLYAGGGMMLSPSARNNDGRLDVITASGLTRANILRELARIHTGGHVTNPKVRLAQGTRVLVETFAAGDALAIEADGNVRGHTPAEFRLVPGRLRIVVPKNEKLV